MKLLFFLLLCIGSGGGIYALLSSYNQKISSLRMDLMLSKKQLSQLQNKFKIAEMNSSNFKIEFLDTQDTSGIIKAGTIVYLIPVKTSQVLQKASNSIKVSILDKASIDNSIWYYVSLPINSNINSKGWVEFSNFSEIYADLSDVTNRIEDKEN